MGRTRGPCPECGHQYALWSDSTGDAMELLGCSGCRLQLGLLASLSAK